MTKKKIIKRLERLEEDNKTLLDMMRRFKSVSIHLGVKYKPITEGFKPDCTNYKVIGMKIPK